MGLVQDDQREAVLVLDQIVEDRADAGHHFGTAKERFVAQCGQDFAVEPRHTQQGVGEIDHQVAVGVQAGDKATQRGGLAGAGLAGDQAQRRAP